MQQNSCCAGTEWEPFLCKWHTTQDRRPGRCPSCPRYAAAANNKRAPLQKHHKKRPKHKRHCSDAALLSQQHPTHTGIKSEQRAFDERYAQRVLDDLPMLISERAFAERASRSSANVLTVRAPLLAVCFGFIWLAQLRGLSSACSSTRRPQRRSRHAAAEHYLGSPGPGDRAQVWGTRTFMNIVMKLLEIRIGTPDWALLI